MSTKPSDQILDEYGLTLYLYDALKACKDPTYWKTGNLTHSITSLYKLRDRGLLTGPKTGQPHFLPFHLTAAGRDLLSRVERGLHKPEWLSQHQSKALRAIAKNGFIIHSPKAHGFSKTTLASLTRAGYLNQRSNIQWEITALGREAWQELKQEPKPEKETLTATQHPPNKNTP